MPSVSSGSIQKPPYDIIKEMIVADKTGEQIAKKLIKAAKRSQFEWLFLSYLVAYLDTHPIENRYELAKLIIIKNHLITDKKSSATQFFSTAQISAINTSHDKYRLLDQLATELAVPTANANLSEEIILLDNLEEHTDDFEGRMSISEFCGSSNDSISGFITTPRDQKLTPRVGSPSEGHLTKMSSASCASIDSFSFAHTKISLFSTSISLHSQQELTKQQKQVIDKMMEIFKDLLNQQSADSLCHFSDRDLTYASGGKTPRDVPIPSASILLKTFEGILKNHQYTLADFGLASLAKKVDELEQKEREAQRVQFSDAQQFKRPTDILKKSKNKTHKEQIDDAPNKKGCCPTM